MTTRSFGWPWLSWPETNRDREEGEQDTGLTHRDDGRFWRGGPDIKADTYDRRLALASELSTAPAPPVSMRCCRPHRATGARLRRS